MQITDSQQISLYLKDVLSQSEEKKIQRIIELKVENEQIAELKTTIDAFQQFILKHNKKA